MAYENHLIDKRVVERNIAKGLVDPAELKQQIASLPDAEANLVHVSVDSSNAGNEPDLGDDLDDEEDDLDDEDEDDDDAVDEGENG